MNRRNFLKRCSLIPFVGSLAAVAKAGASEGLIKQVEKAVNPPYIVNPTSDDDMESDAKRNLHCEICYEDCPLFLQCHGYDSRYMDCLKYPAYSIDEDGSVEKVPYQDFYKTV